MTGDPLGEFKSISPYLERGVALTVDLDGTLVKTDLLWESLWNRISHNALILFRFIFLLMVSGKAAAKAYLAQASTVKPSRLPYNEDVLAFCRSWADAGGKVYLATASNEQLAQAIADHLGFFDGVFASSETLNLKGQAKADLLQAEFAENGYGYIGDSAADFPVWRASKFVIAVTSSLKFRRRVIGAHQDAIIIATDKTKPASYLRALRPHQWIKNILVFIPAIAAHQFTSDALINSVLAFLALSMTASSAYIVNDLFDLSNDRAHPRKRFRPFAAGQIPLSHSVFMLPVLWLMAVIAALQIGTAFAGILLLYFILTISYSTFIKRLLLLDIFTLAGLYTIRLIAGGLATSIILSEWLVLFSGFFFLSLAAIKRQAELEDLSGRDLAVIKGRAYRTDDTPIIANMAMVAGYASVLVMALYLNSQSVQLLYSEPAVLWGICIILLYWISRLVIITKRGQMDDDPIVFSIRDRASYYCFAIILALALFATVL